MVRWPLLLCVCAVGCVAFRPHAPDDAPDEPVDRLALAADALDRNNDGEAALHLSAHLLEHPEDASTRAQLAELLFRQQRLTEARTEYERFVALVQPSYGPLRQRLPHAHTRLMQIAQDQHDDAAEQLHRGIGLYMLDSPMKSVRALRAARSTDPARANLYLALAYEQMGQLSAARTARRCALAAAPFDLTPWERDRLMNLSEQ